MGCSGESDDRDYLPYVVDVADEHDGHDAESADQHGRAARGTDAEAELESEDWEPAAEDASNSGADVDEHDGQGQSVELEAELRGEVFRQPEEQEPPDGVGHTFADEESPALAIGKQPAPRYLDGGVCRVAADVGHFEGAED